MSHWIASSHKKAHSLSSRTAVNKKAEHRVKLQFNSKLKDGYTVVNLERDSCPRICETIAFTTSPYPPLEPRISRERLHPENYFKLTVMTHFSGSRRRILLGPAIVYRDRIVLFNGREQSRITAIGISGKKRCCPRVQVIETKDRPKVGALVKKESFPIWRWAFKQIGRSGQSKALAVLRVVSRRILWAVF